MHTTQSIWVERSLDVNMSLSVSLFTHLAFVSQSIFMINFFSQKCMNCFFFRLRQSHMFLTYVYLKRGVRNAAFMKRISLITAPQDL